MREEGALEVLFFGFEYPPIEFPGNNNSPENFTLQ